jgi:hypothetical protein
MRDDLVYKTHDNGASAPSPAAAPAADGEADPWADWHGWADSRADARIEAALDAYNTSVGEALAMACNDLRDEIVAAFRKRDERIAALEGQVSVLLGLMQGKGVDIFTLPGRKQDG